MMPNFEGCIFNRGCKGDDAMEANPLVVVDTTLRDGEQTAGIVFSAEEKYEMVRLLNAIGIKWIEAGIPAIGPYEQSVLREMLRVNTKAKMIAWNRANRGDVEESLACGFQYIHVSLPVSDFHISQKLRRNRDWVIARLTQIADYVRAHGCILIVGAEDASRADREFFLRYADTGAKGGAVRIRYADTVGCMDPFIVSETFEDLNARCPLPIEFHGHNDFGLAVANTLSAYRSGIPFVSTTSTGIGERAGNSGLERIVDAMEHVYKNKLDLNLEHLPRLANIVIEAQRRKQLFQEKSEISF